jgi:hypothetical protein
MAMRILELLPELPSDIAAHKPSDRAYIAQLAKADC